MAKTTKHLAQYKFKKGVSGNPAGARAHDPEMRMIKHLTKQELAEIGNLVIKNNMKALQAIAKDPNASVIKTMIASVAVKIVTKGDMQALDVLLNRLIGKVRDDVSIVQTTTVADTPESFEQFKKWRGTFDESF